MAIYRKIPDTVRVRGLCASTGMEKIRKLVSSHEVSLGSFSEAQAVFNPDILRQVLKNLAPKINGGFGDEPFEKNA